MRRAQDCGLGTGANVFLTKPALPGFDRLLSTLLDLGLGQVCIAPAMYTPTPRGRRYEALRPELGELLLIARRVLDASLLLRDQWSDLEAYTEAAWARRVIDGTWLTSDGDSEERHRLVCRPNLDLNTGTTGIYLRRHGNMRRDGAKTVLERALAGGPSRMSSSIPRTPAPLRTLVSPGSPGIRTARGSTSRLSPSGTADWTSRQAKQGRSASSRTDLCCRLRL